MKRLKYAVASHPGLSRAERKAANLVCALYDAQVTSVMDNEKFLPLRDLLQSIRLTGTVDVEELGDAKWGKLMICQRILQPKEGEIPDYWYILCLPACGNSHRAVLREATGRVFVTREKLSDPDAPNEGDVSLVSIEGNFSGPGSERGVVAQVCLPACYGISLWEKLDSPSHPTGERLLTNEQLGSLQ